MGGERQSIKVLKILVRRRQMKQKKEEEVRPGRMQLKTKITIRKFIDEEARKKDEPYEVSKTEGNIGLNEGIQELWDLACGLGTPTAYDATNAETGVGDSTTAEAATDTGLLGTNQLYKAMDTGYPTRSGQTVTFRSTYGGAEANFAWNEFCVRNGATAAKDLIRRVSAQGTKASGQTWELTIDITMS